MRLSRISGPAGNIVKLALNRPKVNAISMSVLQDFNDALDSLTKKDRVLIISSANPNVFSAGSDLKERAQLNYDETQNFLESINATFDRIESLEIPTISAIQGSAYGSGVELALTTDLRVCSPDTRLSLPETKLGIIPGAGGTHRLPNLVGRTRALDMILTGRPILASDALFWGLVNRIEEDANICALNIAQDICDGGPLAILAAKKAVVGSHPAIEREAYDLVVDSNDKYEALLAFKEKRKPTWRGN